MHLLSVKIVNIKCIRSLEWKVSEEQAAGWHVILGDNGSGKTAFVKALACELLDWPAKYEMRENFKSWVNSRTRIPDDDRELSTMIRRLESDFASPITPEDATQLRAAGTDAHGSEAAVYIAYNSHEKFDNVINFANQPGDNPSRVMTYFDRNMGVTGSSLSIAHPLRGSTADHIGWFSAAYGPFRKFESTNTEQFSSNRATRHASAFGFNGVLHDGVRWLIELDHKVNEGNEASEQLISSVREFVNHGQLIPSGSTMSGVSSRGIHFQDAYGAEVIQNQLSDGYSSILSLVLDLIRHLHLEFPNIDIFSPDKTQIIVPGVVLIDEVDAHLHPKWQIRIGEWFVEHFPQMQFIVTTHSPLICHAATTIFKLPTPGTDETGDFIKGQDLKRLKYGNILEAYGTGAFDMVSTRSEDGVQLAAELAEINVKNLVGHLTDEEQSRREELQSILPTNADSVEVLEMES